MGKTGNNKLDELKWIAYYTNIDPQSSVLSLQSSVFGLRSSVFDLQSSAHLLQK